MQAFITFLLSAGTAGQNFNAVFEQEAKKNKPDKAVNHRERREK